MVCFLGIESSCDETAVAVVCDHASPKKRVLSNAIFSQIKTHERFGGVIPELAARAHIHVFPMILQEALSQANITYDDIDGIAATSGPGLVGGVMVGMTLAKSMAQSLNKPFFPINHLEGHALTPRLSHDAAFPYLLLLVSGGHTQIVLVHDIGHYEELGTTQDDAIGEAIDKAGKMLGLPHPGGKYIDELALKCPQEDQSTALKTYPLPKPLVGRRGCDFSLSGLKTAVRQTIDKNPRLATDEPHRQYLAHSLMHSICAVIDDRLKNAIEQCQQRGISPSACVVAGGVAASKIIRQTLTERLKHYHLPFIAPPHDYCTDNAAMIAWAAIERWRLDGTPSTLDALATTARPRWPLTELAS